ncbi:MAG TPA: type II toxin-antitoxin system PemK/MazF family toxin [Thermoanaerobaculia bacterium]
MALRGEIYFVSLDPVVGRKQRGQCPVLVVSSDAINRVPLVVVVLAGTDARNVTHDYPTNIRVSAAESGLPHDTVFLGFQIRALDPSRFLDREAGVAVPAGRLPDHRMDEVAAALKRTLDL